MQADDCTQCPASVAAAHPWGSVGSPHLAALWRGATLSCSAAAAPAAKAMAWPRCGGTGQAPQREAGGGQQAHIGDSRAVVAALKRGARAP